MRSKSFLVLLIVTSILTGTVLASNPHVLDCATTSQRAVIILTVTEIPDVPQQTKGLEDSCLNDILEQITANLSLENIGMIAGEVENSDIISDSQHATLALSTILDRQGTLWIRLRPLTEPSFFASHPILQPHLTEELEAPIVEGMAITLANLATGILLYAHDQCTKALPYFENAQTLSQLTSNQEIITLTTSLESFYAGNCALQVADYETAVKHFEAGLAYDNAISEQYDALQLNLKVNLAWTYLQLQESDKTFELMDEVVATAREASSIAEAQARSQRAQLYALNFQYDEAIADMNAAIKLDPTKPILYTLRGQIILLTYEWDAVLADYNKALALDPAYADAYFARGVLFYTQGPREAGLEDFIRYLELAPEGIHAAEAGYYVESIRAELEALAG